MSVSRDCPAHAIDTLVDLRVLTKDDFRFVAAECCRVRIDRENPRISISLEPTEPETA